MRPPDLNAPCWLTPGDVVLPLVPLGVAGLAAAVALWYAGQREAEHVGYGYTLILYDIIRCAMFFSGSGGIVALGAVVNPCWFLAPYNLLGYGLFAVLFVSLAMFAVRVRRHSEQRRILDRVAHVLPPADVTTEAMANIVLGLPTSATDPQPDFAHLATAVERARQAAMHTEQVDAALRALREEITQLRGETAEIARHVGVVLSHLRADESRPRKGEN